MSEMNEWVKWIDEAIAKKHIKHYEYKYFKHIQEIGTGGFGKVYRAKWKNSYQYFALKSLLNIEEDAIKELVHEIELQREVTFHNNVISFHGVTISDQENQSNNIKKYLLVMEYADGGSLSKYLKENFEKLTWEVKLNLAYQLASAVSCLHDEDIIHRDLHSNNVLVNQNTIKLADFGLSKRIEASTKKKKDLFGIVPYMDPKKFSNRSYSLNKKSDVYSVGVLLWEISNGKPPFYVEGESYDCSLAFQIVQGHRETTVPDTPIEYVKLYTECWDDNPDNRPSIQEVVERLDGIINQKTENIDEKTDQSFTNKNIVLNSIEESSHGELSQVIQEFNKMNTKEIMGTMTSTSNQIISQNILPENDLSVIVNNITEFILEVLNNKRNNDKLRQKVIDYFNNQNINPQEIYNWLFNNQNYNSNSIFLLGFFNLYGIETSENKMMAFDLFINASEQDHTLAQYFVGFCYYCGRGTSQNYPLAFKYYEKVANKDCAIGQLYTGSCYSNGHGINKEPKLAIYWYEKAANNGNVLGMSNLGYCYKIGEGVEKDIDKAIYWYKKSAEQGYERAQKYLEELMKTNVLYRHFEMLFYNYVKLIYG
ncbi:kinase-like domain-containing protein [Rhizophagus irregularis DAOM 181602=DAOM 197198]|nr:kinase-like domain-containing protein [Rhizophagus irregularis DAOM 181602=DAOM 197198]